MPVSMYQASVPVFLQLLGGLKGVIEKAEEHANGHKWDENTILNERLYPDMFTLARQVRQASEHLARESKHVGIEPLVQYGVLFPFMRIGVRLGLFDDSLKSAEQLQEYRHRGVIHRDRHEWSSSSWVMLTQPGS